MELEDIKRLRRRFGLTQAQLAKASGVSQSLIAKLESGRIDPAYSKTQKIFLVLSGLSEKEEPKVEDYMIKRIISVKPNDSVGHAVGLMRKHQISQLPVMSKGKALGLVSERTVLEAMLRKENIDSLQVSEVMEEAPSLVSRKTPLKIVMDLLQYSPLIIITEAGACKGVITKADVLKAK